VKLLVHQVLDILLFGLLPKVFLLKIDLNFIYFFLLLLSYFYVKFLQNFSFNFYVNKKGCYLFSKIFKKLNKT